MTKDKWLFLAPQIDDAGRLALHVPFSPGIDVVLEIDALMKRAEGVADAGVLELLLDELRLAAHREAAGARAAAGAEGGAHAAGRGVALLHEKLMLSDQRMDQRQCCVFIAKASDAFGGAVHAAIVFALELREEQ